MATDLFNEDSLRSDIKRVWGEHGAHIVVFDHMLGLARGAAEHKEWSAFLCEYVDFNHGSGISDRAWDAFQERQRGQGIKGGHVDG